MSIKIGIFGFGTVAKATAEYLLTQQDIIANNTSSTIELISIYTRTQSKVQDAGMGHLLVDSPEHILEDKEINCVIELMGGIDFPKKIILSAIGAGKHVVTANKALLAMYGEEIMAHARAHKVCVAFEASCGGGIPIIKAITEGLVANTHSAIYGVLNGTCNFILTEMCQKSMSFDAALKEATDIGLAEADPTLDIDGFDAGHKIAILSSLAFKTRVNMDAIPITGIREVLSKDIYFGKKLKYTMKLIAASILIDDKLSVWVHPAFLPEHHPMTYVEGSFNAVSTIGHEVGHTFYLGRGAGGQPTTSAVIADVLGIANDIYPLTFLQISNPAPKNKSTLQQTGIGALYAPAYIRTLVQDTPGVLTQISSIFSAHNISIARVLQETPPTESKESSAEMSLVYRAHAELTIITHACQFQSVLDACKEIAKLPITKDASAIYPIIENPTDHLS